jgi:hypothetical protein
MNHEELAARSAILTPPYKSFQNSILGLLAFGYTPETISTMLNAVLEGRGVMLAVDPEQQNDMGRFVIHNGETL